MFAKLRVLSFKVLFGVVSFLVSGYVWFCNVTSRWNYDGQDALREQLDSHGPVIMTLWHEHVIGAPVAWPRHTKNVCTLTQDSHAGRLAGRVLYRLGLMNRHLDGLQGNIAITRQVIALAKEGISIGIAVDGPMGPRREAKSVPVAWARATGLPVWGFSYEVERQWRLDSWDKMVVPRPFGRGTVKFRPILDAVPRKLNDAQASALQGEIQASLNAMNPVD